MREQDIPDLNIFMMCEKLNEKALSNLPQGFHIRTCKPNELSIWKEFPFDNERDNNTYDDGAYRACHSSARKRVFRQRAAPYIKARAYPF